MENEKRVIFLDSKEISVLEELVGVVWESIGTEFQASAGLELAAVIDYIIRTKCWER